MHIYDVKMALRDTFYGEPSVLFGAPHQDANALVALSCGIFRLRAMNGRHYWYFFIKDIKNRDLVRFLLRRNGLRPEFHMSNYYAEPQPAFRVQMNVLNKYKYLSEFTKMLESKYSDDMKIEANVARYIDTIKTKLAERQVKKK